MNIDRVLPGDAPLPTREEAQELVLSIMAQLREEAGPLYADLLRYFLLEELDRGWKEHLRNMDFLRDGIGLRGYGQRDPKLEYKREGFNMFQERLCTSVRAFAPLPACAWSSGPRKLRKKLSPRLSRNRCSSTRAAAAAFLLQRTRRSAQGSRSGQSREQAGPQRSLSLRQRQKVQRSAAARTRNSESGFGKGRVFRKRLSLPQDCQQRAQPSRLKALVGDPCVGIDPDTEKLHVQTPPVLVAGGVFVGSWGMGSETREIVMAFSREFGETESPPRWDMKMERCLGGG